MKFTMPKPRPKITGPGSTNIGLAIPAREQKSLEALTAWSGLSKSEAIRWAINFAADYVAEHQGEIECTD